MSKNKIIQVINRLSKEEAFSGGLLFFAFIAAMVWANWDPTHYHAVWNTLVGLSFGELQLEKPLLIWINDGLMALFFFVVGLEIKREVLFGELKTLKQSALPVFAALGGMIIPALLYWLFNANGVGANGWGIPMATDIAFSLAILSLLGSRIPISAKIFLTALAIADDLGGVLAIALYYSSNISISNLLIGAVFLALMSGANLGKVRNTTFYAIFGIGGVWLAFLLSGVHPTIAGILAAFTIPADRSIQKSEYRSSIRSIIRHFYGKDYAEFQHTEFISKIKDSFEKVEPPLQRLEHKLLPWVKFLILPVFALSNAGVFISEDVSAVIQSPISYGIILGLFLGKPIGIILFSKLAVQIGIAEIPSGLSWRHVYGIGMLSGIGFTMSLFIAGLALTEPALQEASKYGVFIGSILSGVMGYLYLRWSPPKENLNIKKHRDVH